MSKEYIFIVDTSDYAGNFERELCAYITGNIGECEVGKEYVKHFRGETGLNPFDNVISKPDDHGCYRPVSIWKTPGYFNHGMGQHYKDIPENEEIALRDYIKTTEEHYSNTCYHAYLKDYQNDPSSREGYHKIGWTEEKLIKACQNEEKKIEKAKKLKKVSKYPSYQSVAIFFDSKPTQSQIDLMKERTYKFAELLQEKYSDDEDDKKMINEILGFRLVQEQTTFIEETI